MTATPPRPIAPPPPPPPADPTVHLILILTAFMGAMVALIIYVAFFQRPPAPALAPLAAASPTCDPRSFAPQCPSGELCVAGRCERVAPLTPCAAADPCDTCECPADRVCYLRRCRSRPPPAAEVCLHPSVRAAMAYIAQQCSLGGHERDGLRSTLACSADDWKRLAIDPDRFDAILAAFPDRFSIHFEAGAPRGALAAEARAHYLRGIERHRERLREAKQVLIIGRASPDGDPGRNYQLSLRRIDEVTSLLREAIDDPQRPRPPLRAWSLATDSPLSPARFRSAYSRAPIAWSDHADALLLQRLQPSLAPADGEAWDWLFGAINRVVLVIPIPCDGTEWDPSDDITFQGDPAPQRPRRVRSAR